MLNKASSQPLLDEKSQMAFEVVYSRLSCLLKIGSKSIDSIEYAYLDMTSVVFIRVSTVDDCHLAQLVTIATIHNVCHCVR